MIFLEKEFYLLEYFDFKTIFVFVYECIKVELHIISTFKTIIFSLDHSVFSYFVKRQFHFAKKNTQSHLKKKLISFLDFNRITCLIKHIIARTIANWVF